MATIRVNWFFWEMEIAFTAIEATAMLFKSNKDLLKKASIERISKEIEAMSYQDPDRLYRDESAQLEYSFEVVYPNTHAYSAISMAYATAEYWLEKLTHAIQQERSLPANSKDFSGDLLQRISKFGEVFGLPPLPEDFVSRFTETKQLRNCIMHSNGRVAESNDRKNFEQMVSRNMGITVDKDGRLQFTIDLAIAITFRTAIDIADLFKLWGFGPGLSEEKVTL